MVEKNDEQTCPACGRLMKIEGECPFCGAESKDIPAPIKREERSEKHLKVERNTRFHRRGKHHGDEKRLGGRK